MITLVVQPGAALDLIEIEQFSYDEFRPLVAGEYMDAIEGALDRLLEHPLSGPEYDGIWPVIRYLSVGRHRLFYDFDGKLISVVRVLHLAMVPEDHL